VIATVRDQRLHRHRTSKPRLEAIGKPPLVICGWLLARLGRATVRVGANLGYKIRLPADACWSCDKRDSRDAYGRRGRASSSPWRCSTANMRR